MLMGVLFLVSCTDRSFNATKSLDNTSEDLFKNIEFTKIHKLEGYIKKLKSLDMKNLFDEGGQYLDISPKGYWEVSTYEGIHSYIGKIKNGKPDGEGIILKKVSNFWEPIYMGEFKKGKLDGYAIELKSLYYQTQKGDESAGVFYIRREGKYRDNKLNGEALLQEVHNQYSLIDDNINRHYGSNITTYIDMSEPNVVFNEHIIKLLNDSLHKQRSIVDENTILIHEFYPYAMPILYRGEMKKDVCEGKGSFYYNQKLRYEGNFKGGSWQGKGIVYDEKGDISTQGEFHDAPKNMGVMGIVASIIVGIIICVVYHMIFRVTYFGIGGIITEIFICGCIGYYIIMELFYR